MSSRTNEIVERIREIVHDTKSGSSQIGRMVLMTLIEHLTEVVDESTVEDVLEEALAVSMERPSMPLPSNLLNLIKRASSNKSPKDVVTTASKLMKLYDEAVRKSIDNARALISGRGSVLLHSYSSTALKILEGSGIERAYISACWPTLEGVRAASEARGMGIYVELVPDLDVWETLGKVDLVLLGCDAVLLNGSLVNRKGSRPIIEEARRKGVKVMVVCDTLKMDYLGMWRNEARTYDVAGLRVNFKLFDITPPTLGQIYVTEGGAFDGPSLVLYAKKMFEEYWIRELM